MTVANVPQAEAATEAQPHDAPGSRRFRALLLVPVLAFLGLAVFLGIGLNRDPSLLPSALIGKPIPAFSLPPVKGHTLSLSTTDLKGQVSLVNVFASWCVACREEHPLLIRMMEQGFVPIHGLNYKDKPAEAAAWLDGMGDPYTRIGADVDGRVAIDWGVYGVPETYVVDREGRIAFKQIGPITPEILREKILPIIEDLRR